MRVVLADESGELRIETVDPVAGAVPSIVDLVPASGWDEREAHDLYGVRFDGHEPLRPLVEHDLDVARWTVPVQGRDAYQVAVGPIHAGVIESGHFRFHLVGEKILHLDARLFYKHRGLERAAEGTSLEDGARYVGRACAACTVTNGVAYAQAVEEALGLAAPADLARARTILLELERVWSHLNDISAVCAGTGLAAGAQRFAGLTECARRLNARIAGHRFLFGAIRIGGSNLALDADAISTSRETSSPSCAPRRHRAGVSSSSIAPSTIGSSTSAIVRARDVRRLGATGPAARAAGVAADVRADQLDGSRTTASSPSSRAAARVTSSPGSSSDTSSSSSRSPFSSRS